MSNKDDFTKFIVDVPNFDNEGNDISSNHPFAGGRRGKDGKLERLGDNFVPLEDYEDSIRDEIREEVRQEMEFERDYVADENEETYFDEGDTDDDDEMSEAEAIGELIGLAIAGIITIADYVKDHPEIKEKVKNFGIKTKNGIINIVRGGANKVKGLFKKKDKMTGLAVVEQIDLQKENLTMDEAQTILLEMLNHYISFRKNFDRLKNAGIIDDDQTQLIDIMQKMEHIIHKHPQLLEDSFQDEIRVMLSDFDDEKERRRLLEVFRIED